MPKNLEEPLSGIRDALLELGKADVEIRALVRTGDAPQHERAKMRLEIWWTSRGSAEFPTGRASAKVKFVCEKAPSAEGTE